MTKIKDFHEKDRLVQNLMIKTCTKGSTPKGAPYLSMVLQDNTGTVEAKLWDARPEDEANAVPGTVCRFSFEVQQYNHAPQLRINQLTPVDQSTLDLSEYILTSSIDEASAKKQMRKWLDSIQNPVYRQLVSGMFARVGEAFFQYPAASRIHHGYLGGLAEHTLGMASLAQDVAELYPQLDRDLLISGVLIHDMGKIAELGGLISGEYSTEGKLTGHISICHGWLMEVAQDKGLADREETLLLRHMVLSHHGHLEFGSPVLPEIPEAEALSLIDNMDARMNTLRSALDAIEPGTWTQRLFALENRQFYKAKNKKGSGNA